MILVFENKEANIQKFGNFKMHSERSPTSRYTANQTQLTLHSLYFHQSI